IYVNPSYTERVKNFEWLSQPEKYLMRNSERLGLLGAADLGKHLQQEQAISVALSPTLLAACAIFTWMRDHEDYRCNIRLVYNFTYAADLIISLSCRHIQRPDICGVVLAPALRIICDNKRQPYQMLMFLPMQSYSIVGGRNETAENISEG